MQLFLSCHCINIKELTVARGRPFGQGLVRIVNAFRHRACVLQRQASSRPMRSRAVENSVATHLQETRQVPATAVSPFIEDVNRNGYVYRI